MESALTPRLPIIPKGGSSRKAKEAAAAAAAAQAAAASAASSATVQARILLDDGTSNILMRSIGGSSEPVFHIFRSFSVYTIFLVLKNRISDFDSILWFYRNVQWIPIYLYAFLFSPSSKTGTTFDYHVC